MYNGQGYPNGSYGQPPPHYRPKVPPPYGYKRKSGGCCLRCICCCYCSLFGFIVVSSALAFYFYTLYEPKVPTYKVQGLDVKAFDVQPDFSLNTVIVVNVEAENPNKGIGFTYGEGSSVIVEYTDSVLCSGAIPNFHQRPQNTTLIQIELQGKSEFGSGLQEALQDSKKQGRIPLLVKIEVPVRIVVGELSTRQFLVFVNCTLVVDNLAPNKKIGILSSAYTFDFKL